MMILTIKNNVIKKIASLFLMLFLVTPIVIKTIHHHHENDIHVDCNSDSTHFHQEITNDCDICYFSFSNFNTLDLNIISFSPTFYNTLKTDGYISFRLMSVKSLKKMRAPPSFIQHLLFF